jgi:hypothetical protein
VSRQAVITPEGLEKLKEEIEHLSTTKRREVAARIKEAREFGDISENAEYDDAKNEQALLEGRIAQLEERLRRATVIDEKALNTEEVGFGSRPTRSSTNSPTSRRSAKPWSGASATTWSRSRCRAGRGRNSKSRKSRRPEARADPGRGFA